MCKRCGECCTSPRLSRKDIERIKKAGYKEEDFVYRDNFGNAYMKEKNGYCIFLRRNKEGKWKTSCLIYGIRPRVCREYPSRLINGSCKPERLAFDDFIEKKMGIFKSRLLK